MTIEDRLRKAFRGVSTEAAPERAWVAIEERIEHGGRFRRRARWAAWLAPLVVAAIGVPAFEALAPAGRPAHVMTTTPTPTPGETSTPVAGAASQTLTLAVAACPIQYGVVGNPPIVPPATATVSGLPEAGSLAAYGGTMVLLGPSGWACQSLEAADGRQTLSLNASGEALPPYGASLAGKAVQAITGDLPNPFGPSKSMACPFFPPAKAAATAAGIPCAGPPQGEVVNVVDVDVATFEDPPGVAGDGAESGGSNPAEGLAFYNPATGGAGMVTCVLPASKKNLCSAVLNDFRNRYGPGAIRGGTVPAPACTARQLSATDDAQLGGGGLHDYYVKLTNSSASPCALSGYPTSLTGVMVGGQHVDLRTRDDPNQLTGPLGGPVSPGMLVPGAAGELVIGSDNACYGTSPFPVVPGTFIRVEIGLPGGGAVTVSGTRVHSYDFTCGALVGQLGIPPTAPK